ncbi:hypothetical protein J1605_020041 [Eschrichtius robustus]|uniref:Regulatory factor X-associated protein RFXANK-binding domain-containing protein n=1 Tax=Eschrichtius robustus TaxID=9764 RepID=A0AB34HMF6_ESCRO|nr:hypothetical protein J1605_020041 [Eschrichtius robustus]
MDPCQVSAARRVQAVAEGRAPPRGPRPCPGPAAASQFTLLAMRPCGGQDEAAALGGSARAARSGGRGDPLWGRRGSGGGSVSKTCTYEGCSQTPSRVTRQRKPWTCKKHRNKMYKDKHKKKKSDQALNCGGGAAQAGSQVLEQRQQQFTGTSV